MKKVLSIVLALVFVLGFASMATAMGPSGADPASCGFWLTSFKVSDTLLSPLMIQNWSGTVTPAKTYAEGQPIWFVAGYTQNKWANEVRDFTSANYPNGITTVFTSVDNCVNYSYSSGYMNFVEVRTLQVIGGTVTTGAGVSCTPKQLEVTITAGVLGSANPIVLEVEPANNVPATNIARSYYLQIMAFTNACNEAQGTAIAKMPVDRNEFFTARENLDYASIINGDHRTFGGVQTIYGANTDYLALYDASNSIKYYVVRWALDTTVAGAIADLANIGAVGADTLYMVYNSDGSQLVGFVSSGSVYRGMVKFDHDTLANTSELVPVQYTSDQGGKYAYTRAGANVLAGAKAVETSDLEKLMTFLSFSFGNDYPVLDKHFQAFAGWWTVLEAKYNVAAAVINVPDPGVDIVPKTGDASTAFGMIMVAIAGLAAVGFVMMKRVRG